MNIKFLWLIAFTILLGACEKVKDKEAVANLPTTSTEDTLVFEPDTVEIDTTLIERDIEVPGQENTALAATRTNAAAGGATVEENSSPVAGTASTSAEAGTAAKSSPAKATSAAKPSASKTAYVRPTKKQLQQALAQDARLAQRMSLPRLKNYWLKRQHYYRRAAKDIKYVAGDVKIKINTEETKIETPKGKVKIEGDDIKVKYD